MTLPRLFEKFRKRIQICSFIVEYLYDIAAEKNQELSEEDTPVQFSSVDLHKKYLERPNLSFRQDETTLKDVDEALLYLSKIGAMKLDGGFLVLYNTMEINRLILDNKIRYKAEDYKALSEYYKQKIQSSQT